MSTISKERQELFTLGLQAKPASLLSFRAICTASLVVSDFASVVLSFALAYGLRFQWADVPEELTQPLSVYLWLGIFAAAISVLFLGFGRLYEQPQQLSVGRQFYGIFSGTSVAVLLIMALIFMNKGYLLSRLFFIYSWALAIITVSFWRLTLHWLFIHLQSKGIGVERLLIIGTTRIGLSLAREVCESPRLGYQLVALQDGLGISENDLSGPDLTERIERIILEQEVDEVIVALPAGSYEKVREVLQCCRRHKIRMKVVPDFFEIAQSHVDLEEIKRIPLVSFRASALTGWNEALKRLADLCLVLPAIIVLAPVFASLALAIKLDSRGSVIYRQTRVGRGGRLFQIYKFRSMRQDADRLQAELMKFNEASGPLFKMRNDPRVTRVGKWLRRLSLDELPQLFNVLFGHMSLVGPRPPIPSEVEQYEDWQVRRLETTPGITGLWQISGRSNLSFVDMVNLDIYYIDNWSLSLDINILLRTIPTVLSTRGAY